MFERLAVKRCPQARRSSGAFAREKVNDICGEEQRFFCCRKVTASGHGAQLDVLVEPLDQFLRRIACRIRKHRQAGGHGDALASAERRRVGPVVGVVQDR